MAHANGAVMLWPPAGYARPAGCPAPPPPIPIVPHCPGQVTDSTHLASGVVAAKPAAAIGGAFGPSASFMASSSLPRSTQRFSCGE